MIHELGVELGAALAAVKCPIRVIDGPEPTTTTTYARERIVIEHDEDGGDTVGPPRTKSPNPDSRFVRNIGIKLTLYVQNPKLGALHWEHRRRAEHLLDLVLVQLEACLYARKNGWSIAGGKFVQPADLAKSETIGGAVYELKAKIERGVYVQNWDSSIAGTFTVIEDTIVTSTSVTSSNNLTPEVLPDTA